MKIPKILKAASLIISVVLTIVGYYGDGPVAGSWPLSIVAAALSAFLIVHVMAWAIRRMRL